MFKLTYEKTRAYCVLGECYVDSCRFKKMDCHCYKARTESFFEGCVHAVTQDIFVGTEAKSFEYLISSKDGTNGTLKIDDGEEVRAYFLTVDGKPFGKHTYVVETDQEA